MTEGKAGIPYYSTGQWAYDVFLNFRGVDTRDEFIIPLNESLEEKGIRTFFDDHDLGRGKPISSSLFSAIEESRIGIVVFSSNYASSTYCLDELVHILDCCKGEERLVLPVFVDVDPSHVRHQKGTYGEALAKHKERYQVEEEKLQRWRQALSDAANLSGWHIIKERLESKYIFIRKIIGVVTRKINRTFLPIGNLQVGLEPQVSKINQLLELEFDERTIMVGICGMGGVGKTTLARALYNKISGRFPSLCFLADVRQNSHDLGLVKLQETLLSEIVEEKDIKFEDVNEIIPTLRRRLQRKKVLLILDDVNELKQLHSLAGGCDWFGSGSRVIITTRNLDLLYDRGVDRVHMVKPLNREKAFELFCWKAFEHNIPNPGYEYMSESVVRCSRGLPLALELIGSNLFGKQIREWESLVDKYKKIGAEDVYNILMVSFSSLDDVVKTVFLDIACCFHGYKLDHVTDLLQNGRGFNPEYAFQVLIFKSYIKIDGGLLRMHDMVRDLGMVIVRQESREPGRRSRLWSYEDILEVLQSKRGTPSVELVKINLPKGEKVFWDGKGFKNMTNSKFLKL